ncbi:MAG: DinB family protein [Gemmataceae bacterium]
MFKPYEQTVTMVHQTLETVLSAVDQWFDKPTAILTFRPNSGNWSISQVLEHVTLTNHYLMLTLGKYVAKAVKRASEGEEIPLAESDLDCVNIIGERGSFEWIRPEHMEPSPDPNLVQTRQRLQEQLAACLSLLSQLANGEGALCSIQMSVNDLGRIDLYQWLYFLAQHARRHLQQMEAIEQEALAS